MSSNKDRIREWFFGLPEETRERIDQQIENIRNQEDVTERHEQTLRKMVKELARIVESVIEDPSQTSIAIKAIANGRISDETIEKALPAQKKRKHKPYERYQDTEINAVDFSPPVTVASDGSESYTKPDGSEGEREREESEEFAELFKEKERKLDNLENKITGELDETRIRLNEALALCDDKDKRIYSLELERGEFEIRIGELKKRLEDKKPSAVNQKQVDTIEELTIERDNLKMALQEMKDIERARIKESGFTTASKMPKQAWIQASNSLDFYIALNKAAKIARDRDMDFLKILFTVADDGQLGYAYLEGDEFQL